MLFLALQFIIYCWAAAFSTAHQPIDDAVHDIAHHHVHPQIRRSRSLQEGDDDGVLAFHDAFSVIWGDVLFDHHLDDDDDDDHVVQLKLDQHSGSGFVSLENYMYAYFSASIKLPSDYTAGIVLAFYTSNTDDFPKDHDELDFEFLGNVKGKPWRLQTNIYGNGSVARGREERFNFWFDPTTDFHNYSILWNHKHIVFFVDDIPIRQMKQSEELGGDYPSKPMALYATMWDGSPWATNGGKYPVNYKYAPFKSSFKNLKINGCATNPVLEGEIEMATHHISRTDHCLDNPTEASHLWDLTSSQKRSLQWVRTNHMYYTYCQDPYRHYSTSLPECVTQETINLAKRSGNRGHHRNKQRAAGKRKSFASPST
ncbi:hypothetical protein L7F22_040408 [Adiantum nelumboides]|nr:hypothetical protein [Adiantum nelumboides]